MTYKSERTGVDRWYMWWPAVRAMPEVQLNYGYSAKLHCDKNNLGPSFIIGWGLAQDERSLKNPARFVNSFFFLKIRPWLQRRIGEVDASGFWIHNVRPWGLLSQLEQLTWPVSPSIFQGWDPTPGASCSSLMRLYCSVSHDYHDFHGLGCVDERCFYFICCHFLSFSCHFVLYYFRIIPCHVVSFWVVSRPSMSCNDSKWHEGMRWNETIEMTLTWQIRWYRIKWQGVQFCRLGHPS